MTNEQNETENLAKLNKLKQKIHEASIGISRVPPQTKKEFTDLAKAEFCDDWGMTLHFLLQNCKTSMHQELIIQKINELELRLDQLESPPTDQPKEDKKKEIKLASGRIIKVNKPANEKEEQN